MTVASDLIERAEKETGQRIDSNEGDNNAIALLMGALSRELKQSPQNYKERDDLAAGILIKHRMSPEGQAEKENNKLIASMLLEGLSPDTVKDLLG